MASEPWGVAEIARGLEVAKSTAGAWTRRSDFPAPVANLASGRVWDADDVREWHRRRVAERRKRRAF